jgi:hypothetical protein
VARSCQLLAELSACSGGKIQSVRKKFAPLTNLVFLEAFGLLKQLFVTLCVVKVKYFF